MGKNLVIVESPAKAKTIEKFLGKDYVVKSCYGHVRDLAVKDLGVDVEHDFAPNYIISEDKKQVIAELKKLTKSSDEVWLATDEDREGEAISWHLAEALGLSVKTTKRIVFHEITKTAITDAIKTPRTINQNLVDAQQARRVLDRLVGFEISPVLWKKVKPSLSAGRVQSVAVRLIVEREKEIRAFQVSSSYKVLGNFTVEGSAVKSELKTKYQAKDDAVKFLQHCINATYKIAGVEKKPAKKSPAPPFTTSTLQQEASRKLGFSVAKTMLVAQQLYESGQITYMRTDSVNLSNLALDTSKAEIEKVYGDKYVKTRQYQTKTKGAQESHEAIRPSYMENHSADGSSDQQRLYDLIWKRTIASQMSDAELERTTITIGVSASKEEFVAKGEVIKFDGFLKVYMESNDDEDDENVEGLLPAVKEGMSLDMKDIVAVQRFTQHPARYTEASLVKKLEELGIGRPSTYAPTISTIQKREYVVNESRDGTQRSYDYITLASGKIKEEVKTENTGYEKNKLFPTDMGVVVTDFLVQHFENILDYNFTANVEIEFDEIANGQQAWNKMIKAFYKPFHKQVEDTLENSQKTSGERILGTDSVSGKPVSVRIGRFGPMVQLGESTEEEKPKFASLLKGQSIETITLEQAMDLFKLPRDVGQYEDATMTAAIGRFGPYIKHKSAFYSLKPTDEPLSVSAERAIEVIEEKRKADREKVIRKFPEDETIQVLKGRFGPYITQEKNNYKIPKDTDPTKLTLEDCRKIIEATPASDGANKKRGFKKRTVKSAKK